DSGWLPSGLFRVNVIYLHFVMLAYNLLWWFKDSLLLGKKLSDRGIRFLREVLFLVPAVVERCGEMFILHLPSAWPFAGLMNEIMVSLARPAPA
ncbi:MAG: transposase, partial [candidate division WOR-3 bacterium]